MNSISILVHRAAKRWAEKRKAERNTDTVNEPHPAVVKQETGQNEIKPETDRLKSTTERQTVQPTAESSTQTIISDKEQTEVKSEKLLATHSRFRHNVLTEGTEYAQIRLTDGGKPDTADFRPVTVRTLNTFCIAALGMGKPAFCRVLLSAGFTRKHTRERNRYETAVRQT